MAVVVGTGAVGLILAACIYALRDRGGRAWPGRYFTEKELGVDELDPASQEWSNAALLVTSLLDPIREALGTPVVVTSGYRTPEHNAEVDGAKNSHHTTGRAADIRVDGLTSIELGRKVQSLGLAFEELGVYDAPDRHIHVATGNAGELQHNGRVVTALPSETTT